jgi:hypothetical protein
MGLIMKKLKRPDGYLIEEYITHSIHCFENSDISFHDNDPTWGDYSNRFCFEFRKGGKTVRSTKWYTKKTAPKWLLAMYLEATNALKT